MPSNDHQTGDDSVWWRSRWLDAMAVAGVKPMPRLVAYVYADHARQRRDAWVPISRLIERTGMSESTVIRSRKSLVSDGWLVETQGASQHRAALFALVIPEAFRPVTATPLEDPDLSERLPRPVTPTAQTCQSDTQSISTKLDHSLSPAQNVLMQVIDCSPTDERLKIADQLLEANNVRSAAGWLRAAAANGTLDERIAEQMHNPPTTSRTTSSVPSRECQGRDTDGYPCGQMIREDRLHLPCPVCQHVNRTILKDVSA